MTLLGTLTIREVPLLLTTMYKQEFDNNTWEVWLNKDIDRGYAEFKAEQEEESSKSVAKDIQISKSKELKEAEEQEALDFASQFVKPK
ncbi:gp13 [Listeria phage P40]|uniref:peptide methionine sulfoxide reductase n=1 Tax=Listeria phage P40 TaxID=560178 RepID=UPI00018198D3|nr:peptide methionine sulfoxide reductase [Listeria phage P40]ACI00373.1 gp13 [Listeria phage P40]